MADNIKIKLKNYDLDHLTVGGIICLLGPRGCGKSFLGRDMCAHLRPKIPIGILFSPSMEDDDKFAGMFPDSFRHDYPPTETHINSIFDRQEELDFFIKHNPRIAKRYHLLDKNILVVADDCLYDKRWARTEAARLLFYVGRHKLVTFLFMMHYPLGVTPDLRGNISQVFVFDDMGNRQKIYDNYCKGVIPDMQTFNEIMNEIGKQKRRCLVIDREASGNWWNKLFVYKAKPHKDFRFGAKILWDYHKKNYCKDYKVRERKKEGKSITWFEEQQKRKERERYEKKYFDSPHSGGHHHHHHDDHYDSKHYHHDNYDSDERYYREKYEKACRRKPTLGSDHHHHHHHHHTEQKFSPRVSFAQPPMQYGGGNISPLPWAGMR